MFPEFDLGSLERYRVCDGGIVRLEEFDPRDPSEPPTEKREARNAAAADIERIAQLQQILYAQRGRALLIVLQGMDASGKDGAIRKVFGPIGALGLVVTGFKKPSGIERAHDYLWRIHRATPARGMIGVFNRSHYEDVLVPRVHGLASSEQIETRYEQINAFEKHLVENGVLILKFFLHISKDEQKERLQARLDRPDKRWKFDPGDLVERARWDEYMNAYEALLQRCGSAWAPWFIVPADRKWRRNAIIARIVRSALDASDLRYPPDAPGLDQIRIT